MAKQLSLLTASFEKTEAELAKVIAAEPEQPGEAEPKGTELKQEERPYGIEEKTPDTDHLNTTLEEDTENTRREDFTPDIKMLEEAIKKLAKYVLETSDPDALMLYKTIKRLLTEMKLKEQNSAVDLEQGRYEHDSQKRYGMKKIAVTDMLGKDIDVHDVVEWEGKDLEIVDVMDSGNVMLSVDDKLISVHPQDTKKIGMKRGTNNGYILVAQTIKAIKKFAYDLGDSSDISKKVDDFHESIKTSANEFQVGDEVDVYSPEEGFMDSGPIKDIIDVNGTKYVEFENECSYPVKWVRKASLNKKADDWSPNDMRTSVPDWKDVPQAIKKFMKGHASFQHINQNNWNEVEDNEWDSIKKTFEWQSDESNFQDDPNQRNGSLKTAGQKFKGKATMSDGTVYEGEMSWEDEQKKENTKTASIKRTANDKLLKNIDFDDLALGVEWPKDTMRQYSDGFKSHMKCDYGFVRNSMGADGEDLDVYIGDPTLLKVFVVDQLNDEGEFDEKKYMIGFPDIKSATSMYLQHQPLEHFGGTKEITLDQFRQIARTGQEDISFTETGA